MRNKLIFIGDYLCAVGILISLIGIKTNPLFWALYAVACCGYVYVNFYKKLYGQAILNFVAIFIAIYNLVN